MKPRPLSVWVHRSVSRKQIFTPPAVGLGPPIGESQTNIYRGVKIAAIPTVFNNYVFLLFNCLDKKPSSINEPRWCISTAECYREETIYVPHARIKTSPSTFKQGLQFVRKKKQGLQFPLVQETPSHALASIYVACASLGLMGHLCYSMVQKRKKEIS
jgi:hypothetical protein